MVQGLPSGVRTSVNVNAARQDDNLVISFMILTILGGCRNMQHAGINKVGLTPPMHFSDAFEHPP